MPGEDKYNYTKEYLVARLMVMLGGRSAEEIAIGQITTGAENDMVEATAWRAHGDALGNGRSWTDGPVGRRRTAFPGI